MALGRQERFYEEADVFWQNLKKFAIFMLTVSVFFHELGHVVANYALGIEVLGFCVFGICYDDGRLDFEQNYFLQTGIIQSADAEVFYSWKEIVSLLSGFLFQLLFSYFFLRILKINFPYMTILLLMACFASSLGDFLKIVAILGYL